MYIHKRGKLCRIKRLYRLHKFKFKHFMIISLNMNITVIECDTVYCSRSLPTFQKNLPPIYLVQLWWKQHVPPVSITIYQTTRCYNPEENNLQSPQDTTSSLTFLNTIFWGPLHCQPYNLCSLSPFNITCPYHLKSGPKFIALTPKYGWNYITRIHKDHWRRCHRPFLLTPLPASVEQSTLSRVRATVITGAMRELHPWS
jgi:hypothetical protein